eukprot:12151815-Karenia_brevis.AAC.1
MMEGVLLATAGHASPPLCDAIAESVLFDAIAEGAKAPLKDSASKSRPCITSLCDAIAEVLYSGDHSYVDIWAVDIMLLQVKYFLRRVSGRKK